MPEAKYISVPDGIDTAQIIHQSFLTAHAATVLADVGLKHVANFLLTYFPPGKLQKNIFQGRSAQADAYYPGAKFPDEVWQELFSI